MIKTTAAMPARNRKLRELIDYQFNGNVSEFAKTIGKSQQVINRLFVIDKRSGKFPTISNEIEKAIIEVLGVGDDYFQYPIPTPDEINRKPLFSTEKIAETISDSREPIIFKGLTKEEKIKLIGNLQELYKKHQELLNDASQVMKEIASINRLLIMQ